MKRPRCKTCRHTMKGHKRQKCRAEETLQLSDGSIYTGNVYDGKPSGHGRLVSSSVNVYVGEFLHGKRHGKGRQQSPGGEVYDGEWANGTYHGYGTLRTPDFTYQGTFYHGKYHGYGEMRGAQTYVGEYSHGTKHGQGTLTTETYTYVGNFYYNLKHGKGIETTLSGSVYSGSWRSGNRHGMGVQSDGIETYTGKWANNKRHGHGKWVSKYVGTYEGHWKRDQRHKQGTHTYIDGSVYTGGWCHGKRTGHGVMNYSDGAVYRGFWLSDEMNGRGTFTEPSGRIFKGSWASGDREGMFVEIFEDKVVSQGHWLCDVRHGAFKEDGKRRLYLWGTLSAYKNQKEARKAVKKMIAQRDTLTAEEVLRFYPKLCSWSLLFKHDVGGHMVHMLTQKNIEQKFRRHAYALFTQGRYAMIERLFRLCTETMQAQISEDVDIVFDAMTKEFVANPWVVNNVGYSETTKNKLLTGLHLGEFGRCPPRNPYTRQILTPASGKYLSELDNAKTVYRTMCTSRVKSVAQIAFEYDMQDFHHLLKNAREANDRETITRLMKERNDFIQRRRSQSVDLDDSSNP